MRLRPLPSPRTRLDSQGIFFATISFRVILGLICLIYLCILGTQYLNYRKVPQHLLDGVPHYDDFQRGIRFLLAGVRPV